MENYKRVTPSDEWNIQQYQSSLWKGLGENGQKPFRALVKPQQEAAQEALAAYDKAAEEWKAQQHAGKKALAEGSVISVPVVQQNTSPTPLRELPPLPDLSNRSLDDDFQMFSLPELQEIDNQAKDAEIEALKTQLAAVTERLAQRDAEIAQRDAEIAQKDTEIDELKTASAKRIAAIRELI